METETTEQTEKRGAIGSQPKADHIPPFTSSLPQIDSHDVQSFACRERRMELYPEGKVYGVKQSRFVDTKSIILSPTQGRLRA